MRKIAVFTGTRAEYGLLYWVIKGLNDAPDAELQLMVGGMHLSPEFGCTVKAIEKDGFHITERMEFLMSSDTAVGISKSMGLALINSAESFERNKPDLLVVLGDRFEAMAVVQAAMLACIPVAHIHGGETTEGLIDEAVRHSITKMSHLHFTATDTYKKRVEQLGESSQSVFNYGAPGIDSIIQLKLLDKETLAKEIDFSLDEPYFMVTYHPVTLETDGASESLQNLFSALDNYPKHKLIITYPNADTHGRKLIEIAENHKRSNPVRVLLVQSLGQLRYLSLLKYCELVIGNSSSGLIEAPSFHVPTVNIGNRQKGRIAGETVIHSDASVKAIVQSLDKALSDSFLQVCKASKNPYGVGNTSKRIVEKLINHPLDGILDKHFHDLDFAQ